MWGKVWDTGVQKLSQVSNLREAIAYRIRIKPSSPGAMSIRPGAFSAGSEPAGGCRLFPDLGFLLAVVAGVGIDLFARFVELLNQRFVGAFEPGDGALGTGCTAQ